VGGEKEEEEREGREDRDPSTSSLREAFDSRVGKRDDGRTAVVLSRRAPFLLSLLTRRDESRIESNQS